MSMSTVDLSEFGIPDSSFQNVWTQPSDGYASSTSSNYFNPGVCSGAAPLSNKSILSNVSHQSGTLSSPMNVPTETYGYLLGSDKIEKLVTSWLEEVINLSNVNL